MKQPFSEHTFKIIETPRLYLRLLTPSDYHFLYSTCSDKDLLLFFGFNDQDTLLKEKAKWEKGLESYRFSIAYFQLILKSTEKIIGSAGFHTWNKDHFKAELGYDIREDEHKRKGFMTEAVNSILHYGFTELGLRRVEACIGPDNQASLGVVNHFNFRQEGHLRAHYFKDDIFHDSLIFSLLKEEFMQ